MKDIGAWSKIGVERQTGRAGVLPGIVPAVKFVAEPHALRQSRPDQQICLK